MHTVYILQSTVDGGYYTGCTSDLEARLIRHNSGQTRSLRKRCPLKVVYSETYNSQKEAYDREKQIKSYKGGVAFKKLINYGRIT